MPGSPQKISPVSVVTGVPSQRTDLPLDSMVSCCRYAAKRCRYCAYGSTAWLWAPKKLTYQTFSRPISSGTLRSGASVRKWSSTAWKPARKSRKPSGPMAIATGRPTAESTE